MKWLGNKGGLSLKENETSVTKRSLSGGKIDYLKEEGNTLSHRRFSAKKGSKTGIQARLSKRESSDSKGDINPSVGG